MCAAPVQGSPSKSFFVDMLTRDIRVSDSILDLMEWSHRFEVWARSLRFEEPCAQEAFSHLMAAYFVRDAEDRESAGVDRPSHINVLQLERRRAMPSVHSSLLGLSAARSKLGLGLRR